MKQIAPLAPEEDLGDISEHLLERTELKVLEFPATTEAAALEKSHPGLRYRILAVAWNAYPEPLDIVEIFRRLDLDAKDMVAFAKIGTQLELDGLMEYAHGFPGSKWAITRDGRRHLLSIVLFAGTTILDLEETGSQAMQTFMGAFRTI